jgi:hypothetical protein
MTRNRRRKPKPGPAEPEFGLWAELGFPNSHHGRTQRWCQSLDFYIMAVGKKRAKEMEPKEEKEVKVEHNCSTFIYWTSPSRRALIPNQSRL